ncbi:SOS response-associated peptidase [Natrialbaceae archaeon GCM10025810]|uniref:SOS response-associated peptidase n=1 Tax=Halovalidus salilacus TaxID=3075124 RepID=UPI00360E320E
MCGRYTLFVEREDLEERFGARFADPESYEPRYNMAPSQRLPVVTNDEPETIRRLEWGLVPAWADDGFEGLINARAETLAEKPSFRDAYEGGGRSPERSDEVLEPPSAGRCLVLANGFYEWVEGDDGEKRPYRVAFEDDRPFAMAGLWSRRVPETTQAGLEAFGGGVDAKEDGGGDRETFAIVTTEPNDLVADLHHRMAAILPSKAEWRWLTADDPRDLEGLLEPHPAGEMRAYPVSTAVNSPANDDPSLVAPI